MVAIDPICTPPRGSHLAYERHFTNLKCAGQRLEAGLLECAGTAGRAGQAVPSGTGKQLALPFGGLAQARAGCARRTSSHPVLIHSNPRNLPSGEPLGQDSRKGLIPNMDLLSDHQSSLLQPPP